MIEIVVATLIARKIIETGFKPQKPILQIKDIPFTPVQRARNEIERLTESKRFQIRNIKADFFFYSSFEDYKHRIYTTLELLGALEVECLCLGKPLNSFELYKESPRKYRIIGNSSYTNGNRIPNVVRIDFSVI